MLITYVYKYMSYSEKYDDIFVYISFDKKNFLFFFIFLIFEVPFDGTAGIKGQGRMRNHSYPTGKEWYKNGEILEVLKGFKLYKLYI